MKSIAPALRTNTTSTNIVFGLPQTRTCLVATHPLQFATEEDYKAHEARVCITEDTRLATDVVRGNLPNNSVS